MNTMVSIVPREITISNPPVDTSGVIRKIQIKMNLPEGEAEDLFEDVLKFLDLTSESMDIIPPPKIDEAWHHFILFTREYADFCNRRYGHFIHHEPTMIPVPEEETRKVILGTLDLAVTQYGKLSDNWKFEKCEEQCLRPSGNCKPADRPK